MWLRICTTVAEKPHCGKTGVPFMNKTTGLSSICCLMRSLVVLSMFRSSCCGSGSSPTSVSSEFALILRCVGVQCQRVQFVAHSPAQGLVNHLMLLHPALAAEGSGNDMGGVMVAVAAQILDQDRGVGQALLDKPLDCHCIHRHQPPSAPVAPI